MEGFLKCSNFRYLGVILDIWIFEHLSVCNFEQRGGLAEFLYFLSVLCVEEGNVWLSTSKVSV